MILIDKAKLMNHIKGFLGIKSPSRVFMEKLDIEWDDVENASTVEAIPIEQLKQWQDIYGNGCAYGTIMKLVRVWERENNETN